MHTWCGSSPFSTYRTQVQSTTEMGLFTLSVVMTIPVGMSRGPCFRYVCVCHVGPTQFHLETRRLYGPLSSVARVYFQSLTGLKKQTQCAV